MVERGWKVMLTMKRLEELSECKVEGPCSIGMIDGCVKRSCIKHIAKTALAYRNMLKRLEWSMWSRPGEELMNYCPMCDNSYRQGHKPDCELAALLKEE
jgi:hypothetical protein